MRVLGFLFMLLPSALSAQELDTAEFAARRAKLLAKIPDGIAVVLGGVEHPYPLRFRQSPGFYYLTGLKEPGTVLVLNGVTKSSSVYGGQLGSRTAAARQVAGRQKDVTGCVEHRGTEAARRDLGWMVMVD